MFEDSLIESGGRLKTQAWPHVSGGVSDRGHDHRRDGTDPADFHGSLAQGTNDVPSGGPPATSTASTARSGSRAAREGDSDRHRERRAAHAHQDSTKSENDSGRRGASSHGFGRGGGWRSGRRSGRLDERSDRQRAQQYAGCSAKDRHSDPRARIVGRIVGPC